MVPRTDSPLCGMDELLEGAVTCCSYVYFWYSILFYLFGVCVCVHVVYVCVRLVVYACI